MFARADERRSCRGRIGVRRGGRRTADGGKDLAGDLEAQRTLRKRTWAARRGELKLLVGSDGSRRLYDLAIDPGEEHDLSNSRPDLVHVFADVDVPFEPATGLVPKSRRAN